MSFESHGELEARLDRTLAAYRDACPAPEPSPDFTTRLWVKIDERRRFSLVFRRLAQGLVTAAALSVLMAIYVVSPWSQPSPVYTTTYLDVLSEETAPNNPALIDIAYPSGGEHEVF